MTHTFTQVELWNCLFWSIYTLRHRIHFTVKAIIIRRQGSYLVLFCHMFLMLSFHLVFFRARLISWGTTRTWVHLKPLGGTHVTEYLCLCLNAYVCAKRLHMFSCCSVTKREVYCHTGVTLSEINVLSLYINVKLHVLSQSRCCHSNLMSLHSL